MPHRAAMLKKYIIFFIFFIIYIVDYNFFWGESPEKSRLQWPAYRASYPRIGALTSVFGESRGSRFHNGIDLAGSNTILYPLARGEILHSRQAEDDPYAPYPGPGNWIFLDHGEGWTSGYYHLKSNPDFPRKGPVDINTPIGRIGNTGRSGGAHLHLLLTNRISKKIVNPLTYLPTIEDETAPQIGHLVIKTSEATTRLSHERQNDIRLTQDWPIYLEAEDRGQSRRIAMGIHKLSWSLNGSYSRERRFEELIYQKGRWLLDGRGFEEVFDKNLHNLGPLPFIQGENRLRVKASDYNGNSEEVLFRLYINKEY